MIIKFSLINLLLILELIVLIFKHKKFNKTLMILLLTNQQNSFKVFLKNRFKTNFKMNINKIVGLIQVLVVNKILGSKLSKLPCKILLNFLLINKSIKIRNLIFTKMIENLQKVLIKGFKKVK